MKLHGLRRLIVVLLAACAFLFTFDGISAMADESGLCRGGYLLDSDEEEIAHMEALRMQRDMNLRSSEQILSYSGSTLWCCKDALDIKDSVMYALDRNGLQVFNIADVSNPILIDDIFLPAGYSYCRLHVDENRLYVGRFDMIFIFDVSEPLNPQKLGSITLSGLTMDIYADGDRAYVGIARSEYDLANEPALYILDVSDPSSPAIIGKYETPAYRSECRHFVVVGDYIYGLHLWEDRLEVISIEDETRPEYVTHVDFEKGMGIAYSAGYLYTYGNNGDIATFDISSPESPVLHQTGKIRPAKALKLKGDRLYLLYRGLHYVTTDMTVYDVSTPGDFDSIGYYQFRHGQYSVALSDSLIFVPQKHVGFEVADVSDPGGISLVTSYTHTSYPSSTVKAVGDYVYSSCDISYMQGPSRLGMFVIDASDSENPECILWQEQFAGVKDVSLCDTLLLTCGHPGVNIYSLTNPSQPELLSHYYNDLGGVACCLAEDTVLYDCGSGFEIGSIADPLNPYLITTPLQPEAWVSRYHMLHVPGFIYIVEHDNDVRPSEMRLLTYNVSNISQPELVNEFRFDIPWSPGFSWTHMARRGNYIYIAGADYGVFIVDISNRSLPDCASIYTPFGEDCYYVHIARHYLFIAGSYSIQVLDISDPLNPDLVQYVPTSSQLFWIDVQDSLLYSAGEGVFIYQLNFPQIQCGDANASGAIDIDDVVFLISYIFGGGPSPDPMEPADVNLSGGIDIDDVVYLVTYIFAGGPPPCD